jgi:hypothetical protein
MQWGPAGPIDLKREVRGPRRSRASSSPSSFWRRRPV